MKKKTAFPFLLFSLSALSGCAQGEERVEGQRQPEEEVETFATTYGNERHLSPHHFANPNNVYRVMPVNNDSPLSVGGANPAKIDQYLERGYGGVVMNVAWGDGYLTSESNFEMLRESVEHAIAQDMRVMLYDEEGYPSGKAKNLTLSQAPENENWEAQGLVAKDVSLIRGAPVTLEARHGHKLEHAFVYPDRDLTSLRVEAAKELLGEYQEGDVYTPSEDGLLVLLYSKNWYEGTHYQNNLMSAARYIDLMKKEPVQAFLRNTYDLYYEKLGDHFGKGIESFFFDEPSLPGMYFEPTSPVATYDEPDPDIAQYPAVNFDDKMVEEFKKTYGYDPTPYLPYLFDKGNANEEARRFRYQYHKLVASRVSSSWSGQLSDWTEAHGVKSAGHFLCEEDLSNHPLMLGDYMANYHEMAIPGIDMTHGAASYSVAIANVAKQAASMASFDNKADVFCEIGQDEGAVDSVKENIANVAILQSMGINYLTSYYRLASEEDDKLLANSLARINYLLAGNTAEKTVGLFYPIDGVYAAETPFNRNGERIYTGSWGFNANVEEISNCYRSLSQSLVKAHVDYDIFNDYMLENSRVENGRLVMPNGQGFTTFVVTHTTAMGKGALKKLREAAENGVRILLQDIDHLTALLPEDQNEMNEDLAALKEKAILVDSHSTGELMNRILEGDVVTLPLAENNSNVVGCKKDHGDIVLYFLINSSNKPQNVTLLAKETGTRYEEYDVYTGEVDGMCVETTDQGSVIQVTLPAFGVGAYAIGGIHHD